MQKKKEKQKTIQRTKPQNKQNKAQQSNIKTQHNI